MFIFIQHKDHLCAVPHVKGPQDPVTKPSCAQPYPHLESRHMHPLPRHSSGERATRCVEQLSQAEAISWNSRAGAGGREEAAGVTMARDICHAWLHSPLLTIGPGDQPVLSFISLPSFPGTLLSLTMGLLSPPRFLPTFNPSKLLLFRPLLSVSARKQNLFETATIHLPPFASVCHYDFLALSLAVRYALCMSVSKPSLKASGKLAEDGNDGLQIGMK